MAKTGCGQRAGHLFSGDKAYAPKLRPSLPKLTGQIPGNLKQCVMKITELHATTGYTGLIVSVRGTYTTKRAYKILSEKAFDIYKRKVEAEPRLSEFKLRLCIWERETDKDGIFRLVKTTYRDFRLIDGKVTLQEEMTFND